MEAVYYIVLMIIFVCNILILCYMKYIFEDLKYRIRDLDFCVSSIREKLKQEESK